MNLTDYETALKSFDWLFEYSDDHRVWSSCRHRYDEMRLAQRQLDPNFEIWNAHAPAAYRKVAKS